MSSAGTRQQFMVYVLASYHSLNDTWLSTGFSRRSGSRAQKAVHPVEAVHTSTGILRSRSTFNITTGIKPWVSPSHSYCSSDLSPKNWGRSGRSDALELFMEKVLGKEEKWETIPNRYSYMFSIFVPQSSISPKPDDTNTAISSYVLRWFCTMMSVLSNMVSQVTDHCGLYCMPIMTWEPMA